MEVSDHFFLVIKSVLCSYLVNDKSTLAGCQQHVSLNPFNLDNIPFHRKFLTNARETK